MIRKILFLAPGAALWAALVITSSAPVRAQQHSYTQAEIEEGRKLYEANCGRCHNDDGAGVTGIELFRQIRRANSDDDLARLIQAGIPGTSMPPHAFSTPQAMGVVAYLRSMVGVTPGTSPVNAASAAARGGSLPAGDAANGKAVFQGKGGCQTCHKAEGSGGTSGPDLSAIGTPRGGRGFVIPPDPIAIERSILDPNADIVPAFRMYQVTPKTGAAVAGRLMNQDTFSVQLLDSNQNLKSYLKSDLKEFGFLPSPMPSYRGKLTPQEVADVVSYLLTLKG
jgi:cytochrome c oxidase cbb3-type subunit III